MKGTRYMAAGILLILGTVAISAQSLGDYARSARNTKAPSQATSTHHYDNDNLPRTQQLSVVGNPAAAATSGSSDTAQANAGATANPADQAGSASGSASAGAAVKNPKDQTTAADERKKADEAMQKKLTEQKQKIQTLNQDLDLTQREYRLRGAAFYADAGNRLRNSAQWDKEDAQYKQQIADKQKALDAAKADLETSQEAARKAGIRQKDDQ